MDVTGRIKYWRVGIIVLLALGVSAAMAWYGGLFPSRRTIPPGNAIMIIVPYRHAGTWVFDDPRVGLVREPFVAGVPELIDDLVAGIPGATNGFRLTFSSRPFPGYQKKLIWLRGDAVGNYYRMDGIEKQGWICPAMFRYYQTPQKELYVRADSKS